MNLVPLRVKIGLRSKRRGREHDHPDFNRVSASVRENEDWSHYVDRFGGWKYDNFSGHDDEDAESPRGFWFGMLLVPEDFATEAVALFPKQCEIMNDAQAKKFYEERHTFSQPEIHEDTDSLQTIAAKRAAGIPEDQDDRNAMDINKPHRGRRLNKLKTWDGYKQQRGVDVDNTAVARLKGNNP